MSDNYDDEKYPDLGAPVGMGWGCKVMLTLLIAIAVAAGIIMCLLPALVGGGIDWGTL